MDNLKLRSAQTKTRREFLKGTGVSLGAIALASLLEREGRAAIAHPRPAGPMAPRAPHFTPKAKNVIYLHMSGAPPQLDLFDYKPKLVELHMQTCPEELLKNQRFAFIKGTPKLLGSPHKFKQQGQSGAWVTELLPHFGEVADDVAFI